MTNTKITYKVACELLAGEYNSPSGIVELVDTTENGMAELTMVSKTTGNKMVVSVHDVCKHIKAGRMVSVVAPWFADGVADWEIVK